MKRHFFPVNKNRHLFNQLSTLLFIAVFCSVGNAAPVPAPPSLTAKSWVLMDFQSNRVIAAKEAEMAIEPASMSKMMTAYAVFDELKKANIQLDEKVRVSNKAWKTQGSKMFIEVDTEVSVDELLNGIIIQSGNDASIAIAEHLAGSEETFAELLNQHAKSLGMTNSHFTNATGLPDSNHYTSALDLGLLSAAIIKNFPDQYRRFAEKSYAYNGITQHNRNRLLWWDKSVDGFKTGHTESAGYCLAASAEREGTRLNVVITGTGDDKTRFQEAQSLLNYGFRFFSTHKLITANEPQTQVTLMGGEKDKVAAGIVEDLYVTIPRDSYDELDARMEIDPSLEAPVISGSKLGQLKISLNGEVLATRPLIALESVGEGSLFKQLKDQFLNWME